MNYDTQPIADVMDKAIIKLTKIMGSNSNRSLTKQEKIGKYAKDVANCRDTSDFYWQTSTGAKIRGELGVERGNEFIQAIKKASR